MIILDTVSYKSTSQGDTWTQVGTLPTFSYFNLFLKNLIGYVGATLGIYKTTNGGANWSYTGAGNHIYDIDFVNNNIGWACGRDGSIYKTINGGNSWITFYSILKEKVTNNYLYSIIIYQRVKRFCLWFRRSYN